MPCALSHVAPLARRHFGLLARLAQYAQIYELVAILIDLENLVLAELGHVAGSSVCGQRLRRLLRFVYQSVVTRHALELSCRLSIFPFLLLDFCIVLSINRRPER